MLFQDRRDAGSFLAGRLKSRAVEPLERNAEWIPEEVPETFSTGV
jgi:hypothetical protein